MNLDDRFLFSLVLAVAFLIAASFNLSEAFGQYRQFRDARGLRGFVAAVTMLSGVLALVGGNTALREQWPDLLTGFRVVSSAGVMGFLAGVVFSVFSWGRR